MSRSRSNDHRHYFQEAGHQGAEVELCLEGPRVQRVGSLPSGLDRLGQVDQLMETTSQGEDGKDWAQWLHCVFSGQKSLKMVGQRKGAQV